MAEMAKIVSTYQKCVRVEKGYLHYDWTYDTNIWMTGGQGGDLHAPKIFLFVFWPSQTVEKQLSQCYYLPTFVARSLFLFRASQAYLSFEANIFLFKF